MDFEKCYGYGDCPYYGCCPYYPFCLFAIKDDDADLYDDPYA